MAFQRLVITAPHSVCIDGRRTPAHPCDDITASYASLLHRELQQRGLPSTLLLADQERRVCDLNRRPCRSTAWRTQLRSLLQPGVFVLDAHSFSLQSEHGAWRGYVLDDSASPAAYSLDFVRFMQSKLPSTHTFALVRGRGNDIMDEARQRGAASFLLELNEQHYRTAADQQPIVTWIADWLQSKTQIPVIQF